VVRLAVTGGSLTRRPKRSFRCLLVEVPWQINEYLNLNHVNPLYFEHKILKMNNIFKLENSKFVHKLINKKLPGYFQNYQQSASEIHCYSTRFATKSKWCFVASIQIAHKNPWNSKVPKFGTLSPEIRKLSLHSFVKFFRKQLGWNAPTEITLIRELTFLLTANPLYILMQKLL